jgi:hypothetical protein
MPTTESGVMFFSQVDRHGRGASSRFGDGGSGLIYRTSNVCVTIV